MTIPSSGGDDLYAGRFDAWSQGGEDGILEQLLHLLHIERGFFVEFGAWDGKHFSNTYRLYEQGWTGCYIEGDERRFRDLLRNCPRAINLNRFMRPTGADSLDSVLAENGVAAIDVLSIDIDGDDLAVWNGIAKYLPAILIIEYNPTIPFDTRYENPPGKNHGNSALSIKEASEQKGYILAEATATNLIFVRGDLAERYSVAAIDLVKVAERFIHPRYFLGFDGEIVQAPISLLAANGVDELMAFPWSGCLVPQPLPKSMRFFGDVGFRFKLRLAYSFVRCFVRSPTQLWRAYRLYRRPITTATPSPNQP